MTNTEQIVKYARVATGIARLAGNSRNPGALVEEACRMGRKLIDVSRTLTDEREAMKAWRSGCEVENMIRRYFGVGF